MSALFSFMTGAVPGFFVFIVYKFFKKQLSSCQDEFYFITQQAHKCQECHIMQISNYCGNQDCSYKILRKLVEVIENSKISLDIAVCALTHPDIVSAVKKVHLRRLPVRIILDDSLYHPADYCSLLTMGIPIKLLGTRPFLIMHNKFSIIDGKTMIRSSSNYNITCFTGSFENIQIIRGIKQVSWYLNYFNNMWDDRHFIHVTPDLSEFYPLAEKCAL